MTVFITCSPFHRMLLMFRVSPYEMSKTFEDCRLLLSLRKFQPNSIKILNKRVSLFQITISLPVKVNGCVRSGEKRRSSNIFLEEMRGKVKKTKTQKAVSVMPRVGCLEHQAQRPMKRIEIGSRLLFDQTENVTVMYSSTLPPLRITKRTPARGVGHTTFPFARFLPQARTYLILKKVPRYNQPLSTEPVEISLSLSFSSGTRKH